MDPLDKGSTPWTAWLRRHRTFLRAVVSFNYDLLLEDLLRHAEMTPVYPPGILDPLSMEKTWEHSCFLLKPHGSIEFATRPQDISMPIQPYPQNNLVELNNTRLIRIPRNKLGHPRLAAYIVLPNEYSPYLRFQWVSPGYETFRRIANSTTHCVFLGLSYGKPDREELNFILDALPTTTTIVEANPRPADDFRSRVVSSKRHYVHWKVHLKEELPDITSTSM